MNVLEASNVRIDVVGRTLLDQADLDVGAGESVAILGPSGSGKTTLLNCVAGRHAPSHGTVAFAGSDLYGMPAARRSRLRLTDVGLVFQFSELLPELTIVENVALPLRLAGQRRRDALAAASDHLRSVGLTDVAHRRTMTLSGGEQQRVGIARATVHRPQLILADEPTGMLDDAATDLVMSMMLQQVADLGAALVLVTHDLRVAVMTDRTLQVRDNGLHERAPAQVGL